jgi:hypothetical protein
MEFHSSHQVQRPDTVSDSEKFTSQIEQSPRFDALLAIVEKYYGPMKKIASRSDDDQESFTSAGSHFVDGAILTSMMALRAASAASEKSA